MKRKTFELRALAKEFELHNRSELKPRAPSGNPRLTPESRLLAPALQWRVPCGNKQLVNISAAISSSRSCATV